MISRIALAVLAGGLTAACATKSDFVEMEDSVLGEIRVLEDRQDALSAELRELRSVLLDSLSQRERQALTGRGEVSRQVDRIEDQVAQLAALVGQNQRVLSELRDRAGPGETARDAPPQRDEEADEDTISREEGGDERPPEEEGDEEEDADAEAITGRADPEELYQASLQQLGRESYGTARAGLEEFLNRYSNHERAPDARFYLAEAYVRSGDREEALEAYARLLELHPNSRRAPSALLKSGQLELEAGNRSDARSFFSRILQAYADSEEAELAVEELRRLDEEG